MAVGFSVSFFSCGCFSCELFSGYLNLQMWKSVIIPEYPKPNPEVGNLKGPLMYTHYSCIHTSHF